jgi:hypothetical protein
MVNIVHSGTWVEQLPINSGGDRKGGGVKVYVVQRVCVCSQIISRDFPQWHQLSGFASNTGIGLSEQLFPNSNAQAHHLGSFF